MADLDREECVSKTLDLWRPKSNLELVDDVVVAVHGRRVQFRVRVPFWQREDSW
jgi:hypothetical protein